MRCSPTHSPPTAEGIVDATASSDASHVLRALTYSLAGPPRRDAHRPQRRVVGQARSLASAIARLHRSHTVQAGIETRLGRGDVLRLAGSRRTRGPRAGHLVSVTSLTQVHPRCQPNSWAQSSEQPTRIWPTHRGIPRRPRQCDAIARPTAARRGAATMPHVGIRCTDRLHSTQTTVRFFESSSLAPGLPSE